MSCYYGRVLWNACLHTCLEQDLAWVVGYCFGSSHMLGIVVVIVCGGMGTVLLDWLCVSRRGAVLLDWRLCF